MLEGTAIVMLSENRTGRHLRAVAIDDAQAAAHTRVVEDLTATDVEQLTVR